MIRLILVLLMAASAPAFAQSSKDYALMAKRGWSEFECAALAASAKKKNKQVRLFKQGFHHIKDFIQATLDGKVDRQDTFETVPMSVTMLMEGPIVDFMLGAIWSEAYKTSHEDVYNDEKGEPRLASLWQNYAELKFRRANCELF